jgi:hypothetical protein
MAPRREILAVPAEVSRPRCRCGKPARYVAVTEAEMGGRYHGTGKTRVNRIYRCPRCATAYAREHGLELPPPGPAPG